MTREDYCSFELSKLLKEKGFDGWCDYFYDDPRRQELRTKDGEDKYWNGHLWDDEYAAPTHQMAMKWLREAHKIFVEVSVCIDTNGDYHYHSMALDKICEYILPSIGTYDTYEEAIEVALKYVLEKKLD